MARSYDKTDTSEQNREAHEKLRAAKRAAVLGDNPSPSSAPTFESASDGDDSESSARKRASK